MQFRGMRAYCDLQKKNKILYGGLAELFVDAMVDVKTEFIAWEWH